MKIKIFIFFYWIRLLFAEFLNKNIATIEKNLPTFICYDKSNNGKLDIYIYGFMYNSRHYYEMLFQIEPEEDELLEQSYWSGNIVYYKQIQNYQKLFISFFTDFIYENSTNVIYEESNSNITIKISDFLHINDIFFNEKDKSIILLFNYALYKQNLNHDPFIFHFKYPYSSEPETVIVESFNEEHSPKKIIPLKDCYIIILKVQNHFDFIAKIFDLNWKKIDSVNITYDDNPDVKDIIISKISETELFNEFIIFILFQTKSVCKIIKYENSGLNFGNDIVISPIINNIYSYLNKIYLFLFKENNINKILFVCINKIDYRDINHIFTVANFIDGNLQFDKNNNIVQYNYHYKSELLISDFSNVLVNKKGISIIYFTLDKIGKYYLNSVCDSKTLIIWPNKLDEFPIEEIVFKGYDDFSFSFINIDSNIKIFKNNIIIKEGEIFTDINNFTYILNLENPGNSTDIIFNFQVKMRQRQFACNIGVEMKTNEIKIGNQNFKCVKNASFEIINNINKTNINNSFVIDNITEIEIYFTYKDYLPKNNELIFYYEKYPMKCKSKKYNVTCKIPIVILEFKNESYIYSKLSCENTIKIGWIKINDTYIKNIYDLFPILNYKDIKAKYDPSQKITGYNSNMINYYYWFGCFAYCDNEQIEKGNCCSQYNITNDWTIIFNKEYFIGIEGLLNIASIILGIIPSISLQIKLLLFSINKLVELINEYLVSIYYYNFVILKSDKYKKIVCAFPGTTNGLQLLLEILISFLIDIPNKNKENYKVSKMFYDVFENIKEDFVNTLKSLSEINDENYQIIFVGHSLGGAIATISTFYCVDQNIIKAEPILLTFGQPRVGNELFAKNFTKKVKQIYRFARLKDLVTLIPLNEINLINVEKFRKFMKDAFDNIFIHESTIWVEKIFINLLKVFYEFYLEIYCLYFNIYKAIFKQISDKFLIYSHIGGLYMIDDTKKLIFNCKDFYNENTKHFICKNDFRDGLNKNFLDYHGYLNIKNDMMSRCQINKGMKLFILRFFPKRKNNKRQMNCLINNYYTFKRYRRGNKESSFLNINLVSNTEFQIEKNVSEILFKYEIYEDYEKDDLIFIINPKNSLFLGSICISQNFDSILDDDDDDDDQKLCYNIREKRVFSLLLDIKKNNDENILYIFMKGKINVIIELLDLSKQKSLNINTSYYFPKISDLTASKEIIFSLPDIKENIYVNLMIGNNNYSALKIYENNIELDLKEYELSNLILLDKNNKYYFKYILKDNELIINFFDYFSNDLFAKSFYLLDDHNLYINYNISNKNDIYSLFFDINGKIKIVGYYSNNSIFNNEFTKFEININEKYITLNKTRNLKYLNIKIYSYLMESYDFNIYKLNEIITITQLNYKYNLKKDQNILFIFDSEIKDKYSIFNSFIKLSINNIKNTLKIINSDENIIKSKNFFILNLLDIRGIFIVVNEEDIFEISLIPETISKYIYKDIQTGNINIIEQNNELNIEYVYNTNEFSLFYQNINDKDNNLKIYYLNNNNFNLDYLINDKLDEYKEFSNITTFAPYNTYIIISKCKNLKNSCIYMKYSDVELDFEYILHSSKIIYLYMNFEYFIKYDENITKIKIKKLNNLEQKIKFFCQNEIINIDDSEEIIDIKYCDGEFSISGNNHLIYIYLPLTTDNNVKIFENTKSFSVNNLTEFFFVPNEKNFNSINIEITNNNYIEKNESLLFLYHIDYGTLPFYSNFENKYMNLEKIVNITIPNYKQNNSENDKYFIYFWFENTVSNLNINIIYTDIVTFKDKENIMIIPSGITTLQLDYQQNYYINVIKSNNNDNIKYSIIRNNLYFGDEPNVILKNDFIYFNGNLSDENIIMKIETESDLFFSLSSSNFYDFSMIIYDKNIIINQSKNMLDIEFNTTFYDSKIEYNIILSEDNYFNNITNYLYHEIINNKSFVYKKIVSSLGIKPISMTINKDEYLSYNKSYMAFVLGKEYFGNSYHYIYYEPKSFVNKINKNEEIELNSEKINEEVSISSEEIDKDISNESSKSKIGIIILIICGVFAVAAIVIIGLYCFRKRRNNGHQKLENLKY